MSNDRPDSPGGPNSPHEGQRSNSSGEWWDQPDADSFNTHARSDDASLDDDSSDSIDAVSVGGNDEGLATGSEMTSASEPDPEKGQYAPDDLEPYDHEEESSMAQEEQSICPVE